MVLVLILLGILILLLTILILITVSTIHIQIKDLELTNMKVKSDSEYAVIISLYLGDKIKWLWFNLNDKKMKNIYSRIQLEKFDFKKIRKDFKFKDLKELPKFQPKLEWLDLEFLVGTISPVTTSFLVATIAMTISIILPHIINNWKKENYKYEVKPLYYNKNLYKFRLNCIIEIKTGHIINIVYELAKKGRKKNEQSTSNRKSYAYSNG